MKTVIILFQILGSLGLFLYGMKILSAGLQKTAGEKLQTILNFMTGNRVMAVLTGFLITLLVQSSSATTVMVVGFTNAGLLSLSQAIGVIMGANVGTTITGWMVALLGFKISVSSLALPAIGIGFIILLLKKFEKPELGEIFLGFGLLFLGLQFLKESVPDIRSNLEVLNFLSRLAGWGVLSRFLFLAVGLVITMIVQSSSAAMAITLTMAYSGWIDYHTAACMVLGENIGTTITAYIASLGTHVNARRASRAHTIFNLIGVVWVFFLFTPFARLVDLIVPGPTTGAGADLPLHLAMFHTLFNLTNTLVLIFFLPQLAKLVEFLVKPKKDELPKVYSFKYLSATLQDTPGLNILEARREVIKMARLVKQMFVKFEELFNNPNKKMGQDVEKLKEMEDLTDQMEEELSRFLAESLKDGVTEKTRRNVPSMIRIVNELESIGDSIYNLVILTQRRYDKKIDFTQEAIDSFAPYCEAVRGFLTFLEDHLVTHLSEEDMKKAFSMEERINNFRNTLKKATQKRLQEGSNVRGELLFFDMIRQMEKVGDYAFNVSQALAQVK